MPIDCKSIFGLRSMASILSDENFFNSCINVGYGVCRYFLSFSGFSCAILWLFSDPHGTVVSQKLVLRESVSTKCTFFCKILVIFIASFVFKNI